MGNRVEQQLNYYRYITQAYEKLQRFRHDTKNHYLCLDSLLARGDMEQARVYLSSIAEGLQERVLIFNTNNYVFDALLTEKVRVAQDAGIHVEHCVSIAPNRKIDDFDWCIMLGNAMDNAIEACQLLERRDDRNMEIKVKSHKNVLNVSVRNRALPPVSREDQLYCTGKVDAENHGFGLSNIQHVVEKYDGVMQSRYADGWFQLTFMLCDV